MQKNVYDVCACYGMKMSYSRNHENLIKYFFIYRKSFMIFSDFFFLILNHNH